MPALTSLGIAETYLTATLSGDAVLMAMVSGVYALHAPKSSGYPFLVYANAAGVDMLGPGTVRTLTDFRYLLKAVSNVGSILVLDAIMARVDLLLRTSTPVAVAGGTVHSCQRTNQILLGDPLAGESYRQLINTYQLQATGG